jgi:2-desacetyl-2-hydroxyethyl bacteriochlorophyllide A dehydrogenase
MRSGKVVVITGPRRVEVQERPVRDPGAHEVLVRTEVSGISAGTEMNVYRGMAPQWRRRQDPATGLFFPAETADFTYPLVYGYANVGVVADAGDAVTSVAPGDRVFSFSPHQEWSTVDAAQVTVLPALRATEHGILVANLNTALNGVLDVHPPLGAAVVVSGLGVIGLIATQLLARTGTGYLAGIDRSAFRRKLAARFGAGETFEPGPDVAPAVRARTGNRGADIVLEVSGAAPALNEAIRIVGRNGLVVALSWYAGTFETLDLGGEFHHNRVRIRSSQVDEVNPELGPLWSAERRGEMALGLLGTLELDPLFTHRFPIERAADAYRCVDELEEGLVQCVFAY